MFELILRRMQNAARAGRVYLTLHANKELTRDDLSFDDALNCILTGTIVEQQFDPEYGDDKYVVYGDSRAFDEMSLVAKFDYNANVLVITVFRLRITDYA